MNVVSRLLFTLGWVLMPTVVASAADAAAPEKPAAPETTLIVNFTETVPNVYGYGSWKDLFAVKPGAGFRVLGAKGAQGDGGLVQKLERPLDLSHAQFVEVALAVQPGNEVPAYNVVLGDADGTNCAARLRVDQLMPGQPVWLRLKLADFTVSTRDPGADGKMDWSKVSSWHLQGDWATKQPAQILFIAIRGRASP